MQTKWRIQKPRNSLSTMEVKGQRRILSPYSKKEREIRYGIVSTRGTKSLAVQKDRKGIRKAHSFKTVKET